MLTHSYLARLVFGLTLALCAISVNAQSGRRQKQPISPVVAAPSPSPSPEPSAKPRTAPPPDVHLFVVMDSQSGFNFYPVRFRDAVTDGCAARLRDISSAAVELSGKDMNRGEAIKKAKSADDTYVIFLNLGTEGMSGSQTRDQLTVEFVVFGPTDADVKITGTTYQRAQGLGNVILGPNTNTNNSLVIEQLLRRAAEDAADRIVKALHLSVQTTPPIH